jgi:hypothetical protein
MAKDRHEQRRKPRRGKAGEALNRRMREYQSVLDLFNATRATAISHEWQSAKALAVIANQIDNILDSEREISVMTPAQLRSLTAARAKALQTAAKMGGVLAAGESGQQNKPPPLPAGVVPQLGGDVAEMAVIVILMMAQDGEQDLNEEMMEAQAQMQAKQATRAELNQLSKGLAQLLQTVEIESDSADSLSSVAINGGYTALQNLQSATSMLQNILDSDNEISEMTSTQLQMLMDTRCKLLQTASDMEKSMADTDMAIVGNIKQ